MMKNEPTTGEATSVTQRIVDDLSRSIRGGAYAPGDRLPSTRKLARDHGVSINTAQAALGRMEMMGLISCSPRRRAVVRASPKRDVRAGKRNGVVLLVTEPGTSPFDEEHIQSLDQSWNGQILLAAQQALQELGMTSATISVPKSGGSIAAADMRHLVNLFDSAAGVIWMASEDLKPAIREASDRGIPFVGINATRDMLDCNYVNADNTRGGLTVGRAFARLGYRRNILFIRKLHDPRYAASLAQGFLHGIMEAGIPLHDIDYHDNTDYGEHVGYDYFTAYLKENDPPQGIFANSDQIAIGAMTACKEAGLSIPDDVGIVGSPGFDMVRRTDPPLTSCNQPMAALGREAVDMLTLLYDDPRQRLAPRYIPVTLTLRESLPHHEKLLDLPGVESELQHVT